MSISLSPDRLPVLIARLREAGCVFAEDEARLLLSSATTPAELDTMVDRRVAGLPLEHVLGWAEFCGVRIAVDTGVFVPRRRTEFLVEQAAALGRQVGGAAVVVDLCCGSGALGVALTVALTVALDGALDGAAAADQAAAAEQEDAPDPAAGQRTARTELHAADIDPAAVRCARRNVGAVGGHVYEGDLYEPLPARLRGHVNLLLANVPYVPTGAIGMLPAEARLHEPLVALDGGADGLDVQRRVAADAASWLAPGGHLLVETSEQQAPHAAGTFGRYGLLPRVVGSGEFNATVVIGTRPG